MTSLSPDVVTELDLHGFAIVSKAVTPETVQSLIAALDQELLSSSALRRGSQAYGLRDLLGKVPEVRKLAQSAELRALVEPILGPEAFEVRGLWFDKTPGANWNLPWHRDLTIAVREKVEAPGYRCWTRKAGIPHVYPPAQVLRNMLTVRLHLDDAGPDNGPLLVLPGSHRVEDQDIEDFRAVWESVEPVACPVPRGGAVLMRPLLLHSSDSARQPGHRRVIHLEYAAGALPGGLQWHETRTKPSNSQDLNRGSGGWR